jgi:hypothetical protein
MISKAFTSVSSIQLIAMVGGPLPPRSVPSAATICAVPSITGRTRSTPSMTAIPSASEPSSVERRIMSSEPKTVELRTVTSSPAFCSAYSDPSPDRNVSARVRVANKKATPSTTAVEVAINRRRRAQRSRRAKRNMVRPRATSCGRAPRRRRGR